MTTKPLPPSNNHDSESDQPKNGFVLSPVDVKAVDELCHILARVLIRMNAEKETSSDDKGSAL